MELNSFKAILGGRVQGVGFRWFLQKHARKIGILGYAKNSQDGKLIIEACGNKVDLDEFLLLVKKGPFFAKISNIEVTWQIRDDFVDFNITK